MGLIGPIGRIKDGVIGTGDSWQLAGKDGSLLCLHDRGRERRNDPNRGKSGRFGQVGCGVRLG